MKAIKSPPDKTELDNRLEKVKELMEKEKLDYYISCDPVNIYYLTNFTFYIHERPFILIIPINETPIMLLPLLEKGHFEERTIIKPQIITYYEFPALKGKNWFDCYKNLIPENVNVGIESSMPVGIVEKTAGEKFIIDIIEEVRIIKTEYEIGRIIHACKIVNKGHKVLLKKCRPKVLEFALYKEVTDAITSKIVQDIPKANFKATQATAVVWPPSISHDPHLVPHIFAEMKQGGPHISMVQVQVDGYGVELERTFFLGYVPEKAKQPFNTMIKARDLAFSLLKPGTLMSDIDKKVREFIAEKGYSDNIIHRTGHGFGITGHEAPYIAEGYDRQLEANMVISIEPGIYIPDLGGFRHSDTVLINDKGYQKLTEAPETLEDLTLSI
ncbi:MAG: M24 family metallopeptidase [Promethearchaeota archaeon]